jgi:ABC-type dipeptide/oligopeptide/nickel transport system permease subunit
VTTVDRPLTGQERAAALNVVTRKQRTLTQDAFDRLVKNKAAMVGLFLIVGFGLVAAFAPVIAPYDPLTPFDAQGKQQPSLQEPLWGNPKYVDQRHPLGTDQIGRDLLSRLIWGARISMVVGFVPVALIFAIGVSLGMLAGFRGGRTDQFLMRLTDVIYAFPDLLFIIIVMATLRNHWLGEILGGLVLMFTAIAVVNWVGMARLVRGQVLSLKEKEYVEAARAIGASDVRIMSRHLLPNSLSPVIVAVAFAIPSAVLAEATLSFLGVGIKPPTATWGAMMNEGYQVFSTTPWPVLLPAICLSVVMLSFTFLGDGLRDALDPRMKGAR